MGVGEGIVFFVVGLGYALITGVVAWRAFGTVRVARASVDWPSVDGVIVQADVVHDFVRSGRYQRRVWVPSVRYEYQVDGERFVHDAVEVSRPEHREVAPIDAIVRPFRVGARVAVYVDPDRPQRATLVTGVQGRDRRRLAGWLLHVGLGLALAGLGVLGV